MKSKYIFRELDRLIKLLKLLLIGLVSIIILWLVKETILGVSGKIENITEYLTIPADILSLMIHLLTLGVVVLLVTFTVLVGPEVVKRMRYDSVSNLKEAVVLTIHLRNFLKKHGEGAVVEAYNEAIKTARIDLRGRELFVIIDLPNSIEVQKMILDSGKDIAEQVSSLTMDDYIFSGIRRVRSFLVLEGTRVPY